MAQKRRPVKQKRQTKAKQKGRAVSPARRKSAPKPPDPQKRAFQLFAEQVDPLWSGLASQCRQFADGFNKALGAEELHVQAEPDSLRVAFPRADAELLLTLDKAERYFQAWLNTGCATYGSCLTDQPPVGLTVSGDALRFVLGGDVISDEQLAVTLLTQLTSAKSEEQS
jgi:hypothetical protein